MTSASAEELSIEVNKAGAVSGAADAAGTGARLFCLCPWRGRRHAPCVDGSDRRPASPNAASRRCATSFPTWRRAASGPIRRRSRMRRCARRWRKPPRRCAGLPLIAGGKSFGGRMTSQAQAIAPLAGVSGLAFFGFPLHPAGKPSSERAKHLADVKIPMLFLQGTRDALAELSLLKPVVRELGPEVATLHLAEGADHSFHVLKSSGRNDLEVLDGDS